MVGGIFSILVSDYFNFIPGLPNPSQKGKRWIQHDLGVAFYNTI